jgi:hypothetical protein
MGKNSVDVCSIVCIVFSNDEIFSSLFVLIVVRFFLFVSDFMGHMF